MLLDPKAVFPCCYGNAERAVVELHQRLSRGEDITDRFTDIRGTAFLRRDTPQGWFELASTAELSVRASRQIINPYVNTQDTAPARVAHRTKRDEPTRLWITWSV